MNVTHGTGVLLVGRDPELQGTRQPSEHTRYFFPGRTVGAEGEVCHAIIFLALKSFHFLVFSLYKITIISSLAEVFNFYPLSNLQSTRGSLRSSPMSSAGRETGHPSSPGHT